MAVQIIVSDDPYQEKLITINRQKFFITFTFNTRDRRWYFDLADRAREDSLTGVKIVPNMNLTRRYLEVSSALAGNFYCLDTKGSGKDITYETFGTDLQFQFWYISDEELEEES